MQEQKALTNATGCEFVMLDKVAHAPEHVLVLVTVMVVLASTARFAAVTNVETVDKLVEVTVTVVLAFVTGKFLLQYDSAGA
jgi:hypothetical protein